MRSAAYAVAILVAAGIMYFIATSPTEPVAAPNDQSVAVASAESASAESASAESDSSIVPDADVKMDSLTLASLTLNVPEMHCPFACYPSVKKNLEKRDDVTAVELAPQKEEGVIDNPQVIVTYKPGFDADQAIAMLEAAGFSGSSVAGE